MSGILEEIRATILAGLEAATHLDAVRIEAEAWGRTTPPGPGTLPVALRYLREISATERELEALTVKFKTLEAQLHRETAGAAVEGADVRAFVFPGGVQ